jgi:protocatechuate 3,4-dioxygenase beta subunit
VVDPANLVMESNENNNTASTITSTVNAAPTPTPSPTPTPAQTVFSVEGRVLTPAGVGVRNAVVTLIDPAGIRRSATTSSFGVYSFQNLAPGQEYTMTVVNKRYRFAPRTVTLISSLTNFDFPGLE